MVTSISGGEPKLINGVSTVAGESVRLTVTGLDENGQMFREAAPILNLNGRDCSFRSKFQPDVGSWMLIEIDLTKQGSKRSTLQGQVRSVQAEGVATNLFQVRVDLETPQEVRIVPNPPKAEVSTPEATPAPVAPSPAVTASAAGVPQRDARQDDTPAEVAADPERKLGVKTESVIAENPTQGQSRNAAGPDRDQAKSEIAAEVKEQLDALKREWAKELEQISQRTVSSSLEQVVRPAIEKQISISYQAAIQTLNSDLSYQVVGRIAGSDELRGCIETLAKGILDEQIGISKDSAVEAQQTLTAHVAELTRNFEASMADMEARLKIARESLAAELDRARAFERESAEGSLNLQKSVEQVNQAARSTIEKFDGHVTAQLNSWSAQFKKHLDDVRKEKSAQFAADVQQQRAPLKQDADEVLEKLSAGLQLARGTLRIQEEQFDRISHGAAAEFEKEIKAILMRLAGGIS